MTGVRGKVIGATAGQSDPSLTDKGDVGDNIPRIVNMRSVRHSEYNTLERTLSTPRPQLLR